MKISVTQAGNFTALIPVLIIILAQFDVKITESEVATLVTSFVALGGIFVSLWGRYRHNDVTLLGVKYVGEKGE
jgi:hypothetical protein